MGVNGLLPAFKGICRPSHISKYRGQKLAVDGYSWLHKGAYCCSRELCEGVWTDRCAVAVRSVSPPLLHGGPHSAATCGRGPAAWPQAAYILGRCMRAPGASPGRPTGPTCQTPPFKHHAARAAASHAPQTPLPRMHPKRLPPIATLPPQLPPRPPALWDTSCRACSC